MGRITFPPFYERKTFHIHFMFFSLSHILTKGYRANLLITNKSIGWEDAAVQQKRQNNESYIN